MPNNEPGRRPAFLSASVASSGAHPTDTGRLATAVIFILLTLLAGAALWQPESGTTFSYHGVPRWSGVWSNPNLYGLLMGVGVVLAAGLGLRGWKIEGGGLRMEGGGWKRFLCALLCLFAAMLTGYGLFKSYSRGAWLGTAVGLGYLAYQVARQKRKAEGGKRESIYLTPALSPRPTGGEGEAMPSSILNSLSSQIAAWLGKNRLLFSVILASVCILTFWQFRFSEARPVQRIFSASNPNDFSWRNRVTAWQGAGQMMLDRPWTGFGWGEAETVYAKKYCPTNESAAIEMNDYLMIGISAGVPALICFLVYIGLAWSGKAEGGKRKAAISQSLLTSAATPQVESPPSIFHPPSSIFHAAICRAGAMVLLVGFWFDGGLFKLPVAIVFWMLLELARNSSIGAGQSCGSGPISPSAGGAMPVEARAKTLSDSFWRKFGRRGSAALPWRPPTRSAIVLRSLAVLLALAAATMTAIHLITPRLEVNENTLNIARKFLVQPKERADFENLAAQLNWQGSKLKTLLEHVELAGYNRELINWKLDDTLYRNFVLSPLIELSTLNSNLSTSLAWRRLLWEEFYPRIRHESSPEDAAKIVVRHLRKRVTVASLPNPSRAVPEIFRKQLTDEVGFQILCVAALRSVGVPARLDPQGRAELFDGDKWLAATTSPQ